MGPIPDLLPGWLKMGQVEQSLSAISLKSGSGIPGPGDPVRRGHQDHKFRPRTVPGTFPVPWIPAPVVRHVPVSRRPVFGLRWIFSVGLPLVTSTTKTHPKYLNIA